MADLVVPQLGESITEAVIAKWLKNVGDAVAADEPLVDLETDKITVQLPSPQAGVLTQQGVPEGATVRVGDVVGQVGEGEGKQAAAPAPTPKAEAKAEPEPAPKPEPAPAPKAEARPAPKAEAKPAPKPEPKPAPAPKSESSLNKDELLKLTPSQRAAAREQGTVPGHLKANAPAPRTDRPAAPPRPIDPRDELVPMSPLRKRVAERLVQAQQETASLTTFNEVDMSAVMALRSRYKEKFETAHGGTKLGFMSFFVRACVAACKLFPGVNAEVVGDGIVFKKHYDFGIAVSTPKGLIVPVLRDCDQRSFAEIEAGIGLLAEKARTGKLAIEDLTGGTFSITNGGIYGSMMSTPLLNYPQTGILGMHNIVKRAVVVDDQVQIRPMMYVALTYDHRVVDGKEAVSFLVAVKERIEAPDRLLIEV
jgi:2-oxoglutarate dehydrogenase E2 component (dihydrolipoamide succinyltransferase)